MRRPFLAIALLIVCVSGPASAQQGVNWDTVQIKTQKLDGGDAVREIGSEDDLRHADDLLQALHGHLKGL